MQEITPRSTREEIGDIEKEGRKFNKGCFKKQVTTVGN